MGRLAYHVAGNFMLSRIFTKNTSVDGVNIVHPVMTMQSIAQCEEVSQSE